MTLRILYVSATNELGGSDASLFELVRCLDRARFEPQVVLPHDGPFQARYEAIGVPVHTIPLKKLKNTYDPLWHVGWLLRAPLHVVRVSRLLARLRPDIVHVNSSVSILAGLAARRFCSRNGAQLVWHARELELRPRWVQRLIFGCVRRWSDAVVAISSPVAREVAPRQRTFVIPNGIDLRRFRPRTHRSPEQPTIGWVGRIAPRKGLENLVATFADVWRCVPRARLVVVGGAAKGHEGFLQDLRRRVSKTAFGDSVSWCGPVSDPETAYRSMSLFVHLPDVAEAFGRTLIEAQASGVPVLTWARGGIPETLLPGQTGSLVAAGDIRAASRAAIALLRDEARLGAMGEAAASHAARCFDATTCAARVATAYHEVAVR